VMGRGDCPPEHLTLCEPRQSLKLWVRFSVRAAGSLVIS
jgi:hypothetical protein